MSEQNNPQQVHKAFKSRTGLHFSKNMRVLYTKLVTISAFDVPYHNSALSLNRVIREKLHTTIVLKQPENILESMDGSLFPLPTEADAKQLTDTVVSLIGNMFYGKSEVKQLQEEVQSK